MVASPVAGFQMLTVSNSAVALTAPTTGTPTYALIFCETNDVRWRDDGTNPTASVGHLLKVGNGLKYDGPLASFKAIRAGAADGTLSVGYYST